MLKKLRVLEIVSSLKKDSGVSSFVFNNNIYLSEYQFCFDYVCHDIDLNGRIRISRLGESSVYHLPSLTLFNITSLQKIIQEELLAKHTYDIVHCNVPNASFLYMPLAKSAGIRTRIVHSHADSRTSDNPVKDLRNRVLIKIGTFFSNHFMACSHSAGQFLFGNNNYDVVYNGIDERKFVFDEEARTKLRNEMRFTGHHVVACVGRLCKQKNQKFLIELLPTLIKEIPNILLVFVGTGDDENFLRRQIRLSHLENYVRFMGLRQDLNVLYSAFDLLVMPSLYEGFPYVAVEAQACNLPIVFSENITYECDLNKLNCRVSLNNKLLWITEITRLLRDNHIEKRSQALPDSVKKMDVELTSALFFNLMRKYVASDIYDSRIKVA